jgi:hypothetical protein
VYWSAPSFASIGAGFAAVSWDQDAGCRFESLDADGTPSTSPIMLGQSDCYMLASSGSGLSFLTSPDVMRSTTVSLVSIDDVGHVKARTKLIDTDAYVMDRMAFDDGSFAVLWLSGSTASYALDYQRFGPDGTPASATVTLGKPVYGGVMARAGSGLLVGWLPANSMASEPVIEIGAVGLDGVAAAEPQGFSLAELGLVPDATVTDFNLASIPGGDVLLTWLGGDYETASFFAMSLSPEGVPRGAPSFLYKPSSSCDEASLYAAVGPDTGDGNPAVIASTLATGESPAQAFTLGIRCVH